MNNNLFRSAAATLAFTVSAVAMSASGVLAGRQDFIIRNATDIDIVRLYVSRTALS
jgi:hypothetical protein